MAENERVQLKREELVGNEVVLSDINPKTNTESIDDSVKGIKLSQTLEKMWNDINNKLSRIVNSVNGRTGVVVLDAKDVGLENVDNISFDDIKKWVINRIKLEFANHRIQLFENLEQADAFAVSHDESCDGTPFYSDHGRATENELRSCIGYFYYDTSSNQLTYDYRIINTIGATDNSIVYNENVNGHDFRGGKIGVNIWKYEDALKLYRKESGQTANKSTLEDSGLYIDKDALLPQLWFFDGCYSNPTMFLSLQEPSTNPKTVNILIDKKRISPSKNIYLGTGINLKLYDLIICNFADQSEYHNTDGSLKDGILPEMVSKQPAIGQVTQSPTPDNPDRIYRIEFFTIRPKTDFGLTYYHQGYDNIPKNKFDEDGIETAHGSILGVKPAIGFTENVSPEDKVVNVSGLTVFGHHTTESSNEDYKIRDKKYSTVFPHGARPIYTSMDKSVSGSLGGLSIVPDTSLCVIPDGYEDGSEMKNLPIQRPGEINDKTGNENTVSNLGVNLLKWRRLSDTNETFAFNLSGLKIVGSEDNVDLTELNPEAGYGTLNPTEHSGGLAVNVGSFLGINNIPDTNPTKEEYYNYGKVEVRIDPNKGLHDTGLNQLGVNLCKSRSNGFPEGGLWFTRDGSIGVNIGPGVAVTRWSRVGRESDSEYMHLCVSIVDPLTSPKDIYTENWYNNDCFGGLRYIQDSGASFSAIGIRVNDDKAWTEEGDLLAGPPSKFGTRALQITDKNILGVQLYKDIRSERTNPLKIKEYTNQDLLYMMDPPFNNMREEYITDDPTITIPTNPDENTLYNYEGEYYIYKSDINRCEEAFVEVDSGFVGVDGLTHNGEAIIPEQRKFYIQKRNRQWDPIVINAYTGEKPKKTVLMPDLTTPGKITENDAQMILNLYSFDSSLSGHYVYFDKTNNKIYEDKEHTKQMTPEDGHYYIDMTDVYPSEVGVKNTPTGYTLPKITYTYDEATKKFKYRKDVVGNDIDEMWVIKADVDHSGVISASTSSFVLEFVHAADEKGIYTNDVAGWEQFMDINGWVKSYIEDEPTDKTWKRVLSVNNVVSNKDVLPGLDLEYNRYRGLHVVDTVEGYPTNIPSLAVNIVDPSNEGSLNDNYHNGGLRFGADGVLAVRINDRNSYCAANPNKRLTSKNSGNDDISRDLLTKGTKGLHIYPGNILGIQINESNEDLEIDGQGNLVISDKFKVSKKPLSIKDSSDNQVTYDGTEEIMIELGPGLALEDTSDEVPRW